MKDKTSALGFLGETTRSDFVFILLVFHLVLVYPLAGSRKWVVRCRYLFFVEA